MNIFINNTPPPILHNLVYRETPTITAHDIPYFHIRSYREYYNEPIHHEPMLDISSTIIDEPFAVVNDIKELGAEADFLKSTGLGFDAEGTFYVSKHATQLYAVDGVFAKYSVANTPVEKAAALAPYTELMLNYILPGLYWRAYYAYIGLAPNIAITRRLQQQMREVSATWAQLKSDTDSHKYAYDLAESREQK